MMTEVIEGADLAPPVLTEVVEATQGLLAGSGFIATPPEAVVTVIQDNATVGVDAHGSPVVDERARDMEAGIAYFSLLDEDAEEFYRLRQRTVQEPTSERAKQELSSFKMLKGIA